MNKIDVLKILLKKESIPLISWITRPSTIISEYKNIKYLFNLNKINEKFTIIKFRINFILLFYKDIVLRLPLNNYGLKEVLTNYSFVERHYNLINIPKPKGIYERGDIVLTSETFLSGEPLRVNTVPIIIEELIYQISPLYAQTQYVSKFNFAEELAKLNLLTRVFPLGWKKQLRELEYILVKKLDFAKSMEGKKVIKCQIHGDLTYRNVLIDKKSFKFCDFARASRSYPEFDFYLLWLDYLTYKSKKVEYSTFFKYVTDFALGKIDLPKIKFYDILNFNFKENKNIEKVLRFLFLYRIIVLSLQNFEKKNEAATALLKFIIKTIKNEIN